MLEKKPNPSLSTFELSFTLFSLIRQTAQSISIGLAFGIFSQDKWINELEKAIKPIFGSIGGLKFIGLVEEAIKYARNKGMRNNPVEIVKLAIETTAAAFIQIGVWGGESFAQDKNIVGKESYFFTAGLFLYLAKGAINFYQNTDKMSGFSLAKAMYQLMSFPVIITTLEAVFNKEYRGAITMVYGLTVAALCTTSAVFSCIEIVKTIIENRQSHKPETTWLLSQEPNETPDPDQLNSIKKD